MDWKRIWNEAVMDQFGIVFWNFSGGTEECHERIETVSTA
jgi:hypothetical protein